MDKTVIYITNNVLDKKIDALCKENILSATKGLRLISVSQKPISYGENICVGYLKPSSLSINIQMMEGLKKVTTEFIAIAEHDCLYTAEHFAFTPKDDSFWYNENVWCLLAYSESRPEAVGTFSTFPQRKANSQLIVRTEQMIRATQDRIDMMSDPAWLAKYPTGRIGEAGVASYKHFMRLSRGRSVAHIREKLKKYLMDYKGENFRTVLSNVDIKHHDNLTKNTRGYKRRFKIPYWGTIEDIFKNKTNERT